MVTGPFLKWAADGRADYFKEHASQSVVYKRGANSVPSLQAVTSQLETVIDDEGVIVTVRSRDFIFLAADLVLNGLVERPEKGDRITWEGNTYEVMPIGGEKEWGWTGSYENQIAVHTQEIKTG